MGIPLTYSLRGLWVRRTTTLASVVGITLVVFVLASTLMLADGVRATLVDTGSRDKALVLQEDAHSEGSSRLRQAVVSLVAAAPGVKRSPEGAALVAAESLLHLPFHRSDDPSRIVSLQIRGVSPNVKALRPEVRIVEGRAAKPGTDEAIVGRGLVGRYADLALGQSFELQRRPIEIVGVFAAEGTSYESEIWADIDSVRSAFGWEGYVSSITAQLDSPAAFDHFAVTLQHKPQHGLKIERESAYYERVSHGLSEVITALGFLVTVIFALGALLGATITMYGAVGQRQREIGVLRALGFGRQHVLLAFVVESTLLGFVGGTLGIGLSLLTQFLDFSTMNFATGQEVAFRFLPSASAVLASALAGTLVGTLGGLSPAIRAARTEAVVAMRA